MSSEPRLTNEDRRIWRRWKKTCLRWSQSRAHRRKVEHAKHVVRAMHSACPDAYVAWSAGKDSTALAHLVANELGKVGAMAIKDDLDYPGEVDYLQSLAPRWGVDLDILKPNFSLQQYLSDHADEIDAGEDLHGRASAFAERAFYSLIDTYRERMDAPGVYLGMRADESDGRAKNFYKRGHIYTKKTGEVVCQPLATWVDRDVYAYVFAHDIPLLPVYRCVRLHDRPGRVRKSWWLPGSHSRHGATVWMKTYWPSLYRRLCELLPDTRYHA